MALAYRLSAPIDDALRREAASIGSQSDRHFSIEMHE
jgi:hypothetical protein